MTDKEIDEASEKLKKIDLKIPKNTSIIIGYAWGDNINKFKIEVVNDSLTEQQKEVIIKKILKILKQTI